MSLPPRLWATTRVAMPVSSHSRRASRTRRWLFCVIAWALSSSTAAGSNTAQVQWLINTRGVSYRSWIFTPGSLCFPVDMFP